MCSQEFQISKKGGDYETVIKYRGLDFKINRK